MQAITRKLLSATLVMTPILTLAKALHFGLIALLAIRFGATGGTDAALFAFGISSSLNLVLGSAVETSIIPMACAKALRGRARREMTGPLVRIGGSGAALLILAGAICPAVLPVATGFSPAAARQIGQLLLWLSPAAALQVCGAAMRGMAYAHGGFFRAGAAQAIEGAAHLGFIIAFASSLGANSIAFGYLASNAAAVLFLWVAARRTSPSAQPAPDSPSENSGRERSLLYAQVFASACVGVNPVVDQAFVSLAGPGAVTIYTYASRLFLLPVGLALSGFLPAFLATLSQTLNSVDAPDLKPWFLRCLLGSVAVSACVAVIAGFLAGVVPPEYVSLGKLGPEEFRRTLRVATYLYVGLIPYVAMILLVRVHIALLNRAAVLAGAIVNLALNFLLDAAFVKPLGIEGIALSSGLTYFIIAGLLGAMLARRREWSACAA
jgi:putative peptidoglycan lipid II flippase